MSTIALCDVRRRPGGGAIAATVAIDGKAVA